jgi:hypothetical protein
MSRGRRMEEYCLEYLRLHNRTSYSFCDGQSRFLWSNSIDDQSQMARYRRRSRTGMHCYEAMIKGEPSVIHCVRTILDALTLPTTPINSLPLSKVICLGHGYLENHSCSTVLATVMDCLSSYCWISNQLVAGSIIVTHLQINSSFPFYLFLKGPIKSTHSLSHGGALASFGGRNSYFLLSSFISLAYWANFYIIRNVISHVWPP